MAGIRFALRDLAIVLLIAGAWALEVSLRGGSGAGPWIVRVIAGVGAALAGFLLHEWGHLAGAWLGGAVFHFPERLTSPFLFYFDVKASSRRAFLWMSMGGYIASAVALAALAWWLPWEAFAGRLALGLAAAGILVTFALEVPTTVRVARGAPLPRSGPAYR